MANQNAKDLLGEVLKLNDALAEADRAALRLAQYESDHLNAARLTSREASETLDQIRTASAAIAQARDTCDMIRTTAWDAWSRLS